MRESCVAATVVLLGAASVSAQGVDSLWSNNCANCHGNKGQGGGAGTRTLLTDDLFDQSHDRPFYDAIKNGLPEQGMDAFGATMSNEKVWALVNYIRELQSREQRQRLGSPAPDAGGAYHSSHHAFRIETVIDKGLNVPWSVEILPDGGLLVTNRPGDITYLTGGKTTSVEQTPAVRNQGQGGLMDITLHPNFKENGWVYLAFSDASGGTGRRGTGMTKIVRGKLASQGDGLTWSDQETVFEADKKHYLSSDIHFGCKIVFDPTDSSILFFGIGERGHGDHAQDLDRPNGKIHRLRDDGSVPSDNPFVRAEQPYPSIWSFGHRNPQGLVFDLEGVLWDTEHGPRGGDELNVIERARNYGWPIVSFGINYTGAPLDTPWPDTAGEKAKDKNIAMPADRWMPSIGACGLEAVSGEAFPNWKGDLLAGGLSGSNVDRFRVKNGMVTEREELLQGIGRVRDIRCAPDGSVYVVLNDPDKVIRLVPLSLR